MNISQDAFRRIVEQHQARVFSIAFRILGESATAEEVAQDVFLELHRDLVRLESDEHITAWLRRVACHRATDALRRRTVRMDQYAQNLDENVCTGRQQHEAASPLTTRIEQLLLALPVTQRSVMLMRYQEDLEPEEIAAVLAMPLATVRSHLQRALKLLRAKAERTLKEYIRD